MLLQDLLGEGAHGALEEDELLGQLEDHGSPAKKRSRRSLNSRGRSSIAMCPAPASTASSAPPMPPAMASASARLVMRSSAPAMTSVPTWMRARRSVASKAADAVKSA